MEEVLANCCVVISLKQVLTQIMNQTFCPQTSLPTPHIVFRGTVWGNRTFCSWFGTWLVLGKKHSSLAGSNTAGNSPHQIAQQLLNHAVSRHASLPFTFAGSMRSFCDLDLPVWICQGGQPLPIFFSCQIASVRKLVANG